MNRNQRRRQERSEAATTGLPVVTAMLFCEDVDDTDPENVSILRLRDRITLIADPGGPDVMPAFAKEIRIFMKLSSGPAHGKKIVRLERVSPSGEVLTVKEDPMTFLGGDAAQTADLIMPTGFTEEGLYWYVVRVDGHIVGRAPLAVVFIPATPSLVN